MLSFDVQVSGGQVGSALANDPEECAEMLCELANDLGTDELEQVQEYLRMLAMHKTEQVKDLLTKLLQAVS